MRTTRSYTTKLTVAALAAATALSLAACGPENTDTPAGTGAAPDSKFVVFDATGKKALDVLSAATPLPKCTSAKFQGVAKGTEAKGCTIISTTG
ncbi:hypothetical protein ACIQOW_00465 [Kitasatospora sp. NPDC091335]|uniref:hypothetical protein n=1 Tax=Kitasatospora sp. NPDC091335 TaxID=3364085 RepID=UPI003822581D